MVPWNEFHARERTDLQPLQRVSAPHKDIVLHIDPKGKNHVDDNRRTEREKGNVYKPQANAAGSYTHLFSNGAAYAKCFPFNEIFNVEKLTVHDFLNFDLGLGNKFPHYSTKNPR
jgi:hypothetical protein